MNEAIQRKMFDYLSGKNIQNFIGVPDSTMKSFIERGLQKKKIIITTREEEAIGIAAGMTMADDAPAAVFMQNAGFANSLSTITSLVQLYNIPILFIIGWRGYLKTDAPEHVKIGGIQKELLRTIGLDFRVITDQNWKECLDWALQKLGKKPCALVIRRLRDE